MCPLVAATVGWEIIKVTPNGLFTLLSSVSCGAFVLATDQTVVYWNGRAREILGYARDRVLGRRCFAVARGVEGVTLSEGCDEGCLMLRSLRAGLVPSRARMRMRCSWGEWKSLVVTPMVVSGLEQSGPLLVYLFGDSDEEQVLANVQRLVELGGDTGPMVGAFGDLPGGNLPGDPEPEWSRESSQTVPREMRQESSGPGPTLEDGGAGNSYLMFDGDESGSGVEGVGSGSPAVQDQGGGGPRGVHLTEREREVLGYLALGWETKYIAEELGVSWYTVRSHIENLRRKLGAANRLEAVMAAMRLGIIQSE